MSERPLGPDQVNVDIVRSVMRNRIVVVGSSASVIVGGGLVCGSDDGTDIITLPSDLTLTMPTDLDTGTETATAWYYIWLMKNPTTGSVIGKFSLSLTSPVMPSGYTKKRLVSAVKNYSSNFIYFYQAGRQVELSSQFNIYYGGLPVYPSWTGWQGVNGAVPFDLARTVNFYAWCVNANVDYILLSNTSDGTQHTLLYNDMADHHTPGAWSTSTNVIQTLVAGPLIRFCANSSYVITSPPLGQIAINGYEFTE